MAENADKRYVIGLDIGTTSLCAVAADTRDGRIVRTLVRPNRAALPALAPDERLQRPDEIVGELIGMLEEWRELLPATAAIGISAQMHGVLYVDRAGRAVSPLYTWQDGRGDRPLPEAGDCEVESGADGCQAKVFEDGSRKKAGEGGGEAEADGEAGSETNGGPPAKAGTATGAATYRQQLEALTGYPVPSGYGLLTHDVLRRTGAVPADAAKLCTIGDYAAMRLTGRPAPLADATQAAGLGLFDLRSRSFDLAAAARAGIDAELLPELAAATRPGAERGTECEVGIDAEAGEVAARDRDDGCNRAADAPPQADSGAWVGVTPGGIPVAAAIGDNQASYLGAAASLAGCLLFNVGTGAQLSLYSPQPAEAPGLELRPFPDGGWLLSGASLGGGKTYALLADFYREIAEALGTGDESRAAEQSAAGLPDERLPDERLSNARLPDERLYAAMNRWALAALDDGRPLPRVDPAFFGTRAEPGRAASIAGLTPQTLTPQALTAGLLAGVADELAAFAAKLPSALRAGVRRYVGAGGGIRRNPALRRLLEARLGARLEVAAQAREEAACGAAVHAAVCAGIFTDYEQALAYMGGHRLTEGDIV